MAKLLVYATALQAMWGQRGDSLPHRDHLSQEASLVVLSKDDYVTSTYHSCECGEAIVRTYKSSNFSEISPID